MSTEALEKAPYKMLGSGWLKKPVNHGIVVVPVWLVAVFLLTSYLPKWVQSQAANLYLVQPVLWLSVLGLAYAFWRLESGEKAFPRDHFFILASVLVGLFQVSVFVLAGVLVGFGYSPYAHQPGALVSNTWFFATRLAALEMARWYLLFALKKWRPVLRVGATWLLFTLLSLPLLRFWSAPFTSAGEIFQLAGGQVMPAAAENILTTYLAFYGGPWVSMAYRFILAGFEWYSPILPNLRWTLTAFLGTIVPVLGILFTRETLDWRPIKTQNVESKKESFGTGWIVLAVVLVFILWFNTGLFGVRPTLITGISMEPTLHTGDIVVTRDVSPGEVQVGDVVLFRDGNRAILHRVIQIDQIPQGYQFLTKGDNVEILDPEWDETRLKGKLVLIVPKIGWVSIGLKLLIQRVF